MLATVVDLRARLEQELDVASWEDLRPHRGRGGLLVCAGALSPVDVGHAIALDRAELVAHWVAEGVLSKPGPDEDWAGRTFEVVIVQPFVVARLLEG